MTERAGVSATTARRHLESARDDGEVIAVSRPGYAGSYDYYRPIRITPDSSQRGEG